MARVLKNKELVNTRLSTNYGGWMYCENCNDELIIIKNRFCCPKDSEPLITILDKKVNNYEMKITCKSCENIYKNVRY